MFLCGDLIGFQFDCSFMEQFHFLYKSNAALFIFSHLIIGDIQTIEKRAALNSR